MVDQDSKYGYLGEGKVLKHFSCLGQVENGAQDHGRENSEHQACHGDGENQTD